MDTSSTLTPVESSTPADAQIENCVVSAPARQAPDWIRNAVARTPRQRNEFSRYQLGEIKKPYAPPVWMTKADQKPQASFTKNRRGPNPLISASRSWYQEWRNRDWDATDARRF